MRTHPFLSLLAGTGALAVFLLPGLVAHPQAPPGGNAFVAPKIWDEQQLATWSTPVAGINTTPHHYSEQEYYAAPVDNLRTYPVYFPGKEPPGYHDWLRQQEPQPLIEVGKPRTEAEWIDAGRRVFEELDLPIARTDNPRLLKYLGDAEAIKKDETTVMKNGVLPDLRWVVEKKGQLKVGLRECAGCHYRVLDDGTPVDGAPGNTKIGDVGFLPFREIFENFLKKDGKPLSLGENFYITWGVPWLKDDIHAPFKTMKEEELRAVDAAAIPGTFPRFNGSPYFTTKISDLIGVRERGYLDHTATHANRGPTDIARYGILVSTADDGSIGPHKFMTEEQRRLPFRFSDDAMFALGMYVYSLKPPPNPNKLDDLARRGQEVFDEAGCASCHRPPEYTNNRLMPVIGFDPPVDSAQKQLRVMKERIDTDPGTALKTRKGTGYYQVPSLKGLWYRGLLEHSGSVATLEEWFDRKRLRDEYVPSGWRAPGVKARAVPGHEFGLDLPEGDKRALIAFLKTL